MSGRTEVLSARERQIGFRNFLKHITWNGLGVFLVNHTVVSLMAIHFGASNLELGYINSAFHVSGLASLLVPRLFEGVRTNRLFGWAWMVRGWLCVFYGLLLVLSGPAARVTIIAVFSLFALGRAVGISVVHTVQRDFMRDRDAAGLFARLNFRLGFSQLASQLTAFGLLSLAFFEGIFGLVVIVFIGAVMNTVAAWYLLRVPGRGVVEHTPDQNVVQTFLWSMRQKRHALPLLVHWLGVGLMVMLGFQVVFLRRVLELPDNYALLFTAVGALATIFANLALKPFADSVGEKPLIVITTFALGAVALVWMVIPATLPLPVYFVLGFVAFFFGRSILTLKSTLLVKSIPERNRVPYTAAANTVLGVVALSVGLIGGGFGDLGAMLGAVVPHEYSLTFLFTAALAGAVGFLAMRLRTESGMSVRETADIMFSARNLRAFLDAYQLDFAVDPARRESLLLSLERSPTTVATSRLRERLRGPSVSEKERVLRTLFRSPRTELLPDIIGEALDEGSYNRRDAVFCLGGYNDPEAEAALRKITGEGAAGEAPAGGEERAGAGEPPDAEDSHGIADSLYTGKQGGPGNGDEAEHPVGREERSGAEEPAAAPVQRAGPEEPAAVRGASTGGRAAEIASRACPPDMETVAVAYKSLARIGCADVLGEIRRLLRCRLSPRAELDLSVAESTLDPEGPHLAGLFQHAFSRDSARFAVTRLLISLNRLDFEPGLGSYLRSEARSTGQGFYDLIEDASEFELVRARHEELRGWIRDESYCAIGEWARQCLATEVSVPPRADVPMGPVPRLVYSYVHTTPPPEHACLAALTGIYLLHRALEALGPAG